MKFNTLVKIVTALAAAVGAIYIAATYGDKIVEWAKGIMDRCCPKQFMDAPVAPEAAAEDFAPAEEPEKEEAPAEAQEPAEDPVVEPILSDDAIPVANEEDFEG